MPSVGIIYISTESPKPRISYLFAFTTYSGIGTDVAVVPQTGYRKPNWGHDVMKNRIAALTALLSVFLIPLSANADPIIDIVEQNVFVDWFDSHTYSHDVNDDGFVLGSATGGTLSVTLSDDGGFFDSSEIAVFIVEAFDFDTGGLTFGSAFIGDLELAALGALNVDGLLDITIQSVWGDFYVGNSTLTVYTSIPEPGTLALLGLGLAGLGFARRRRSA